jgi:hypothetical protein
MASFNLLGDNSQTERCKNKKHSKMKGENKHAETRD